MKTSLLIIIGVSFLVLGYPEAHASCATFVAGIDNIKAYNEASTVFVGTVQNAHVKPDLESNTNVEYTTFTIHYMFKGNLPEDKVRTNPMTSIGYNGFEEGQIYFVYAYDPANTVHLCVAPIPFPFAMPLLFLHFPFVLVPAGVIAGMVFFWRRRK